MKSLAMGFAKDECGATAMEYGLLSALVAVAIIAAARKLGLQIGTTLVKSSTAMKGA